MSERIDLTLTEAVISASAPPPPLEARWFERLKNAIARAIPSVYRETSKWVKKALEPREAQAYAIKKGVELRKQEIENDRVQKLAELERLKIQDVMKHEERMTELKIQALEKITSLIEAAHANGVVETVSVKEITGELFPSTSPKTRKSLKQGGGS